MTDHLTVERVDLQKKDKSELQTIVAALGGKSTSRTTKAELIESVLRLSGALPESGEAAPGDTATSDGPEKPETAAADTAPASPTDTTSTAAGSTEPAPSDAGQPEPARGSSTATATGSSGAATADAGSGGSGSSNRNGGRRRRRQSEPPAEWETELAGGDGAADDGSRSSGTSEGSGGGKTNDQKTNDQKKNGSDNGDANAQSKGDDGNGDEVESGNRRRRRRGRGRDRDDEQLPALEPITAAGYLDLRDDGYGFLRVNGYLQSADDVYVPVKMARLYGLRKGDLVEGTARPANRNEKNPALQTITSINGADPDQSKSRVRFEDLTAVYPFERLDLETPDQPTASAARLVDLVAPMGKGQRSLLVSPPESGAFDLIKQVGRAIEQNHPETHLMVLLFDGRPEDVVEIERSLEFGEVGAASFDASPEEQCALVDFTIERAKRMVEAGEDVVIIADGLTSIARAYSLGTQPTGRTITGVDACALHPTKWFFGSARKLEEAGSLTILATITVGTGAVFDEALFDEFQGTATSEIHLDAWLADEGVFPNIDLELSRTRSADLLVEPEVLTAVDAMRALMAAAIDEADGPAVEAARRLVERLEASPTNEAFLDGISSDTTI